MPFARARLTALVNTGASNAAQSYTMPDGTQVRVRLVNGEKYIFITGGDECLIVMDSGVVDIRSANDANPLRFVPGILHRAGAVVGYDAPFSNTATPPKTGFTNPSKGSAGQFDGVVIFGSDIKGRIQADHSDARSFSPGKILNPADPPTPKYIPDPEDGHLVGKKTTGVKCPASMFSGKTRLWVQAMYGRATYGEDKIDKNGVVTEPGPALTYPAGDGMTMGVGYYAPPGDKATYFGVTINTSTGVYLDKRTGQHWLIVIYGVEDGATVYPLVSDKCGERQRRLLKAGSKLSEEDLTHVEAYVLSTARPYVKYAKKLPKFGNMPTGNWSLGYGWHWNWSGTKAVCTSNIEAQYAGDASVECLDTATYNLTFSMAEGSSSGADGAERKYGAPTASIGFSASGVVQWLLPRTNIPVIEPLFAGDLIFGVKTTPRYEGKLFDCNATFYSYFIKDELKECRVSVTKVPGHNERHTSPGFDANPIYHPGQTFGLNSGFGESKYVGPYWSYNLDIAGKSATLDLGKVINGSRIEVSAKSIYDDKKTDANAAAMTGVWLTSPFVINFIDAGGTAGTVPVNAGTGPGEGIWFVSGGFGIVEFERTEAEFSGGTTGGGVIMAPAHDSQAMFFNAEQRDVKNTGAGSKYTIRTSAFYGWHAYASDPAGPYTFVDTYYAADYGGSNRPDGSQATLVSTESTPGTGDVTTTVVDVHALISAGVVAEADPIYSYETYVNNIDICDVRTALSGTNTASPVVMAPAISPDNIGITTSCNYPVLVGWV